MSKDRAYIGERFIKIMRCANSEVRAFPRAQRTCCALSLTQRRSARQMDDQMGVRHMHGYGAYGAHPRSAVRALHDACAALLSPCSKLHCSAIALRCSAVRCV